MITIIIPAHNEKANLISLIPQLKQLTLNTPCDILVALSSANDDGSEAVLSALNVTSIRCKKQGRAVQMNTAATMAKGNILVFLHADVIPPNSFIQDIQKTIAAGYEAGFFSYRFDSDNFFLKINASFTAKDGIFTGGGDQCLFIKKSIFERLGMFDENQVLMEDFEFFDRMKRNNVKYKIIKNDLIVSARKYTKNSYLRVNMSNLLLLTLYRLGFSSHKLKRVHNRLLRTSY